MNTPFLFILLFLGACSTTPTRPPSLSNDRVEHLLPEYVKHRAGWAQDIVAAIEQIDRAVTVERVCAAVAIIEQESGFQADPIVKDLPKIVRQGLEVKFKRLGPLSGVATEKVLKAEIPGGRQTFEQKISKLKTESDLDHLFREIESALRNRFPGMLSVISLASKLMGQGWLEEFNPVTTAGSMQVKVSFAKSLSGWRSLSDAEVRDLLYTRKGGVRAGVARLLDYEADYDDILYRFADYNAGIYSSRNAAFQTMLSDLQKTSLVADGDLLAYHAGGSANDQTTQSLRALIDFGEKHGLAENDVRKAARGEKSAKFEESPIWKKVREIWTKEKRKAAPYATLPRLTLNSPKFATTRSTEWFARIVKRRYLQCRGRS